MSSHEDKKQKSGMSRVKEITDQQVFLMKEPEKDLEPKQEIEI